MRKFVLVGLLQLAKICVQTFLQFFVREIRLILDTATLTRKFSNLNFNLFPVNFQSVSFDIPCM